MSEKTYKLDFTKVYEGWAGTFIKRDVTESALVDLEQQIKAIREQAEAEKPKAWDFGLAPDNVHVSGTKGWSSCDDPHSVTRNYPRVHILGNLKDIVENQGPIVIGMTEEEAAVMVEDPPRPYSNPAVRVRGRIMVALARYRKGKPTEEKKEK